MEINLFGFIPIQGVFLANFWVIFNLLPMILFLLASERSVNVGWRKYVLWVFFAILCTATYQLNDLVGGWLHILTVVNFLMYALTARIGYDNWSEK